VAPDEAAAKKNILTEALRLSPAMVSRDDERRRGSNGRAIGLELR
jgi:hypothetical protein